MAYTSTELARLSGAAAGSTVFTLYYYANTADDDVTADNFFDDSADQIRTGDMIIAGGTTPQFGVATNTAGAISLGALDVDPTA